jgi:general secretion pathway protein J
MRRARGFTLVELLVALFALALMAVLSWRGLDGMMRARRNRPGARRRSAGAAVGLAQWAADLDAIVQLPQVNALDWNGRVLRLTRAAGPGRRRAGGRLEPARGRARWMRWQSPPLTTRGDLDDAWRRADPGRRTQRQRRGSEVAITPLEDWQIFFFRGDAWTNPLSSDAQAWPAGPPAPRGHRPPVPARAR